MAYCYGTSCADPVNLQDLVLLEYLTREGQILGGGDASNKAGVLWDDIRAIAHEEDASHVKLDVVVLLGLEKIEGRAVTEHQYAC